MRRPQIKKFYKTHPPKSGNSDSKYTLEIFKNQNFHSKNYHPKNFHPNKFQPKKFYTQNIFTKKIFTQKNFTQIVRLSFVNLRWAQLYVSLVSQTILLLFSISVRKKDCCSQTNPDFVCLMILHYVHMKQSVANKAATTWPICEMKV